MKITVDIDCTPKELRSFFGLPDLEPLQQEIMAQMQRRASEGLSAEDLQQMMSGWMTGASTGMEQFQKLVQAAMTTAKPKS
ncbi:MULTISPECIES: DUF6489 family protein [unclassified Iodidimonas]|jgi:hypothetical protein|uniref:DUF6489 family protein n=1 Tax=unclassified Iodidimonas TaxID=2626145 RepID=UPI002482C578|nr:MULTISPECIES: DUF6489 family protein [unclassified Iodidimonas]